MNQEIMVSVICTVYNHEKYVRDALDGFVMQKTNFPFEVLIHDDASTDNSANIIREYEAKYPDLIKPIYQVENQFTRGGNITRRFLLPKVRGKYVAVCEGDDYWTDPCKLQKQVDFLENNPDYSMCVCSTVWLDMRTMRKKNGCLTTEDRDVSLEEIILERKGRPFHYSGILARAYVFLERPEWLCHFGVGDTPLAIHAALTGKVRMFADVGSVYRNHAQGSWTSRIDQNIDFKVRSFNRMISGMEEFNEATQYQYQEIVTERINLQKYRIAITKRDWKSVRQGELWKIYKSKKFAGRVADFLHCKAPRLEAAIRRLTGK